MPTKRCSKCGEQRDLTEYYAAQGTRDGLRGDCTRCFAARRAARYDSAQAVARTAQWRKDNPARFAAWQAEYRNRPETWGVARP